MVDPIPSHFDLIFQNQSTEGKIVASLERISEVFRVLLWQQSNLHKISPIQIQILIFLLHHNKDLCHISYLAKEFNMAKATVSDSVKTLLKKELILKVPDLEDARSFTIELTAKGKKIAKETSFFTQVFHEPLSDLSKENRQQFLNNLLGVITHFNQVGVISVQRMCKLCSNYSNKEGHFCSLLNKSLAEDELRIDCPEFAP